MAAQLGGQLDLLDPVAQRLLHEGQQALHFLGLFLRLLLFLLGLQAQILGGNIAERLLHIGHQGLRHELIHVLGEQQHVIALLRQGLHLRQLAQTLLIFAGSEINLLLTLGHGVHILLEGDQLALLVAVEQQQILRRFLVCAVVGDGAVLQLTAKGGVEFLVLLPVVFQHGLQLGFDLLLDVPGDDGQLAVVLEHFTADVQGQILTVHNAADKAEVLGQQILAVVHNQHAAAVQLQSTLVILGVEIVRRLAGDIQQRLEGNVALHVVVDGAQGLIVVEELVPVEGLVLFFRDVLLVPLPDGHHGVQGLHLGVGLVLGRFIFLTLGVLVLRLLHGTGLGDLHPDGVADIVGILADQATDLVFFQILGVFFVLGIGFQGHDDVRSGSVLFRLLDGIAVRAVGDPLPCLVLAVLPGDNGDGGSHHKGGIETDTELTDDIDVLVLLHGLLEAQRAGLGDGTEILDHFVLRHTDAVIGNGQGAVFGVAGDGDGEFIPVDAHLVVGQRRIGQLIDGIGGVGDDLPKENLLVGINGVNHQVKKTLRLCFELLLFHNQYTSLVYLAL